MGDCPFIPRCSTAYQDSERCRFYYEDCRQYVWFIKKEMEKRKEKLDLSDLTT